ncbi:MAG: fumarylacetoacetate hydrolase family protein, partial [Microbacteriaceae bacterium]|nr:fumarylacetoacetate hydrolase family protein [Microbacteriaceae bacterium]
MRFARIETADGPRPVVLRGETWAEIVDMFADELEFTGRDFVVDGARLLAPVIPTVLVGISHNLGNNDHRLPIQAFLKSPRTVVGTGAPVSYREGIGAINVEAELAIVIGRNCRNISFDKAFDVVFGYTVANDVTNVGQVAIDEKFSQVKN